MSQLITKLAPQETWQQEGKPRPAGKFEHPIVVDFVLFGDSRVQNTMRVSIVNGIHIGHYGAQRNF